jgi:hypothetical protein
VKKEISVLYKEIYTKRIESSEGDVNREGMMDRTGRYHECIFKRQDNRIALCTFE